MRRVWPWLRVSAALIFAVVCWQIAGCVEETEPAEETGSERPDGCVGKCDGTDDQRYQSAWQADLGALNAAFTDERAPIQTIDDAYSVLVDFGNGMVIRAPTHKFGVDVQVIP